MPKLVECARPVGKAAGWEWEFDSGLRYAQDIRLLNRYVEEEQRPINMIETSFLGFC